MRIWLISDTHFGVRSNNKEWIDIMLEYFNDFFIPLLLKNVQQGDILVHCGDIFDSRNAINLHVLNLTMDIFEKISYILPIHMITGNHDVYNKTNNDIHSLKPFKHLKNVSVYNTPSIIDLEGVGGLFLPWCNNHIDFTERALEGTNQGLNIMFCHSDFKDLHFNKFSKIEHGPDIAKLSQYTQIFSGHIHHAQNVKNVCMLGSPYELTRTDMDNKKAVVLYDVQSGTKKFIENTISPKFKKIQLTSVLNSTISQLQPVFHNNFVDLIIANDQLQLFPLSDFIDLFYGYKKITNVIQETTIIDTSNVVIDNNFNISTLILEYINCLDYSDDIKLKIHKKSVEYYNQVLKDTSICE